MTEFTVDSGLSVCVGGIFGAMILAKNGASCPSVINNEISCFWINGHYSLRRFDRKRITIKTLREIGKEVLHLKRFTTKHISDHMYHIIPVK